MCVTGLQHPHQITPQYPRRHASSAYGFPRADDRYSDDKKIPFRSSPCSQAHQWVLSSATFMQCIHALFLLDVHIFNHFRIIIVPFHGQASLAVFLAEFHVYLFNALYILRT